MRSKVIMLTGSAPPEACGVGDYTSALVRALECAGFPVEMLCHKRWDSRGTAQLLRRLSREERGLLHIQYPTFGYGHSIGPQLCSLTHRSVITLHEFSLAHVLRKVSLFPFTLRSDRLIMTAEFESRMLTQFMPWTKQKIALIPIGSNIPPSQPASIAYVPRVLYHGLVMPRKGLEEWLALAQLARDRKTDWEFVVVGKIPVRHETYAHDLIQTLRAASVRWVLGRTDEEVAAEFSQGGGRVSSLYRWCFRPARLIEGRPGSRSSHRHNAKRTDITKSQECCAVCAERIRCVRSRLAADAVCRRAPPPGGSCARILSGIQLATDCGISHTAVRRAALGFRS